MDKEEVVIISSQTVWPTVLISSHKVISLEEVWFVQVLEELCNRLSR